MINQLAGWIGLVLGFSVLLVVALAALKAWKTRKQLREVCLKKLKQAVEVGKDWFEYLTDLFAFVGRELKETLRSKETLILCFVVWSFVSMMTGFLFFDMLQSQNKMLEQVLELNKETLKTVNLVFGEARDAPR